MNNATYLIDTNKYVNAFKDRWVDIQKYYDKHESNQNIYFGLNACNYNIGNDKKVDCSCSTFSENLNNISKNSNILYIFTDGNINDKKIDSIEILKSLDIKIHMMTHNITKFSIVSRLEEINLTPTYLFYSTDIIYSFTFEKILTEDHFKIALEQENEFIGLCIQLIAKPIDETTKKNGKKVLENVLYKMNNDEGNFPHLKNRIQNIMWILDSNPLLLNLNIQEIIDGFEKEIKEYNFDFN